MLYVFWQRDLPKLDLQVDPGTDFIAWTAQWEAYRSLSGLDKEPQVKQVKVLTLCFCRKTLTTQQVIRQFPSVYMRTGQILLYWLHQKNIRDQILKASEWVKWLRTCCRWRTWHYSGGLRQAPNVLFVIWTQFVDVSLQFTENEWLLCEGFIHSIAGSVMALSLYCTGFGYSWLWTRHV